MAFVARASDLDPALSLQPAFAFPLAKPQTDHFSIGGGGEAKFSVHLAGPLRLELGAAEFWYAGVNGGSTVSAFDVGVGPRLQFPVGNTAFSPYVSFDLQYVRTGRLDRVGIAPEVGVRYKVSPTFSTGIFARYQLIFAQHVNGYDDAPAHLMQIGVLAEFGFDGSEASAPKAEVTPAPAPAPVPEKAAPVAVEPTPAPAVVPAPPVGPKDSDGDGVPDSEDKCPTVAGPATSGGCADTDGDGVADSEDKCPAAAGPAKSHGCPDSDGDGVSDADDRCPTVAGPVNGCVDTDKDGVADLDDRCPNEAGEVTLKGCADTDKDGIADLDDTCPKVAGEAKFGGCDKQQDVAISEGKITILKKIYFYPSTAKLKEESVPLLKEVARVLVEHPAIKVRVEGHTDKSGQEPTNQKLSQERADAVLKYMTSQGVQASRLTAQGFGSARPIDDNATPAGRENNRRVEFVVVE